MRRLEELPFENRFGQLPDVFHARVQPTPLEGAHLIHFNRAAAALIDLDPAEARRPEFVAYFNGEQALAGTDPLAACYAGHQFGTYVPRLGDGRAILLGEVVNSAGGRWDLQVKGAGPTPYSRSGDGRAVLRSSIREYLAGEALHGLGIPTSRALCLIGSTEEVWREHVEPGAAIVRMAPTHVRFGSFEYFYYTNQFGHLHALADYVLQQHLPRLLQYDDPYLALLEHAVVETASTIAQWQAVGFAHGVLNTDNMSILGLTLDYGPYGFLDTYEPGFVCNHSDHSGRYAFDRQPDIGLFNLSCLAQAMLPLLSSEPDEAVQKARAALEQYKPRLVARYAELMRARLGLREAHAEDQTLVADLLALMNGITDYTLLFRALSGFDTAPTATNSALRDLFLDRDGFDAWAARYRARLQQEQSDDAERRQRMNRVNPKYILRNWIAEQCIRKAEDDGDYSEIDGLVTLLQRPCDEHPDYGHYAAGPPDWAKHISVSCSS